MRYLFPFLSVAVFGQFTTFDVVPLQAGSTESVIEVKFKNTMVPTLLPLVDEKGNHLQPQPRMSVTDGDGLVKITLTGVHFWGKAGIPNFEDGKTLWLQRGPTVTGLTSDVDAGQPVAVWVYNHDTAPMTLRWRLRSGIDAVCGMTAEGVAKEGCATSAEFESMAIPPATSKPIWISPPERWFHSGQVLPVLHGKRKGQLELYFGENDKAPVQVLETDFTLRVPWYGFFDFWLQPAGGYVARLIGTILLVTLGAALLMCAQVIAPGFRKCLALENQLDTLQERLNSISDSVGMRLTARCSRDLKNVRAAILMKDETTASASFRQKWTSKKEKVRRLFRRIALFGSTLELTRVGAFAQSIDTRIRLAERLDELRSEEKADGWKLTPMTLRMMRDDLNAKVEMVVSRQDLAEGDAQVLIAGLTEPTNVEKLRSDFRSELEARIERVRKELGCVQWKAIVDEWLAKLPTAKALFENGCVPAESGWSDHGIYLRDADTIRLELVYLMIGLKGLKQFTDHEEAILELLRGSELGQIKEARRMILQVTEGVFEEEIEKALIEKQWDMWSEPDSPSDLDVLKVSLRFRNPRYNHASARDAFQCLWMIEERDAAGNFRDEEAAADGSKAEPGWDIQIVPRHGTLRLSPKVFRRGKNVREQIAPDSPNAAQWRKLELFVPSRIGEGAFSRLMRGFVDAALTAIVPVVTVAVTQAQSGSELEWTKLVSIGFTSQAIRSAVLPEPVAPAPVSAAPSRLAPSAAGMGTTSSNPIPSPSPNASSAGLTGSAPDSSNAEPTAGNPTSGTNGPLRTTRETGATGGTPAKPNSDPEATE